jgi:hypothetical protein
MGDMADYAAPPPPEAELTAEEVLLSLPPPLTDPAETLPTASLDAAVPAEHNPFTLVRVPGDELSIREAEEADDGWGTMDVWAVDVPGAGTATRDVLAVVRRLAGGSDDEDEGMRHLKRVRKGKKVADNDGSGSIPRASTSLVALSSSGPCWSGMTADAHGAHLVPLPMTQSTRSPCCRRPCST